MMRPLFLLGIMRSGTTYFRNVLASNRSILALGSELNGFWTNTGRAPAGLVSACPFMDGSTLDEEVRVQVRNRFDSFRRSRNLPWMIIYRAYRKLRFGNETMLKTSGQPYLLNKSTHLHNKIGYIDRIFPEARYIFLLRDLPANANSLLRHLARTERKQGYTASLPERAGDCWEFHPREEFAGKPFTFEDTAGYWLAHNRLALEDLTRLEKGRVLLVRYEDIVSDLNGVLERFDEFLGFRLNRDVNRKIINNTTDDPLHSWQRDLDAEKLRFLEDFLEEHREEYETIMRMMDSGGTV